MRADGDGSDRVPVSAVREAVAGSGLSVGDSQEGRTNLTDQVRQVSIAIGAMLVFTLLIALSGLANTIDVSVLERTREIGVLRATGTQRSEIRRLLITEPSSLRSWAAPSASCSATGWVSQGPPPCSPPTPPAS